MRWPLKKTPREAPSQHAAQPDFLLLCLSMIHFAGLESLTSCVTEKKRNQSNAIKIAGHTSIIPQQHAAKHGASASRDLFLASLSAIHTYSILYTVVQKSNLLLHFSRITRFNRIDLRYHRPHRRCGPVALRGEAALKPSRVVGCAPGKVTLPEALNSGNGLSVPETGA